MKATIFTLNAIMATGLLLANNSAFAVLNAPDMNPDDYKDYVVQINTPVGNCGSALINGRYLVTARHCADSTPGNTNAVPDSIEDVSVWQSPYYRAPKTEGHEFFTLTPTLYFANTHSYLPLMTQRLADVAALDFRYSTSTPREGEYISDVVVIKLAEDVVLQHSQSTAFVEMIDWTNTVPVMSIEVGDELVLNGWGVGEYEVPLEEGDLAHHAVATIKEQIINLGDAYHTKLAGEQIDYVTNPIEPENWLTAILAGTDAQIDLDGDALTTGGDSGTPFLRGDEMLGLKNSLHHATTFNGLLPFLAETIDDISTVTQLKSFNSSGSWTFPVQNLTFSDFTLEVNVTSGDGITIDKSDCLEEMKQGEFCTLVVDALTTETTETVAEISMLFNGNERIVPVILNATPEVEIDYSEPVEEVYPPENEVVGSGGSGGGGSFGFFGLVFLGLFSLARRVKKTN